MPSEPPSPPARDLLDAVDDSASASASDEGARCNASRPPRDLIDHINALDAGAAQTNANDQAVNASGGYASASETNADGASMKATRDINTMDSGAAETNAGKLSVNVTQDTSNDTGTNEGNSLVNVCRDLNNAVDPSSGGTDESKPSAYASLDKPSAAKTNEGKSVNASLDQASAAISNMGKSSVNISLDQPNAAEANQGKSVNANPDQASAAKTNQGKLSVDVSLDQPNAAETNKGKSVDASLDQPCTVDTKSSVNMRRDHCISMDPSATETRPHPSVNASQDYSNAAETNSDNSSVNFSSNGPMTSTLTDSRSIQDTKTLAPDANTPLNGSRKRSACSGDILGDRQCGTEMQNYAKSDATNSKQISLSHSEGLADKVGNKEDTVSGEPISELSPVENACLAKVAYTASSTEAEAADGRSDAASKGESATVRGGCRQASPTTLSHDLDIAVVSASTQEDTNTDSNTSHEDRQHMRSSGTPQSSTAPSASSEASPQIEVDVERRKEPTSASDTSDSTDKIGVSAGAMQLADQSAGSMSAGSVSAGSVSAGLACTGTVPPGAASAGSTSAGSISAGSALAVSVSTGSAVDVSVSTGSVSTGTLLPGALPAGSASAGCVPAGAGSASVRCVPAGAGPASSGCASALLSDQSADTASDSSQDDTGSESAGGRDITHLVSKQQPNPGARPTRSNLKRRHPAGDGGGSSAKRPRRCIQFDGVTVFYFPRAQGFTCIPSQGGSTLGMADWHSHVERFTLADHVDSQRAAHRQLLSRLRLKQRKLQPSASSSEDSDASAEDGSDISDSELDVDSYFFLRPVTTRQRRAMLRASGVRKIEPVERDECRDIRTSREFCGCACKLVCRPDVCQCAGAGIKCQVDRQNFPCGCTRDGCHNPTGRIEFNPARVRSHFVETIMREQPPASAAALTGAAAAAAGVWASCGWQKVEHGAAGAPPPPPQPQYMAEQELPAGYQTPAAFVELTPAAGPYQEDSYSENSDGSRDSYDGAAAAPAQQQPPPPPVVYPSSAQTQTHYSSFSFEGGLQSYASPAPPPPPYGAPAGYQPAFPACQAYPGHAYPTPPHYTYPFNKFPPSGPGPGGGPVPGTVGSTAYPAVCGGTGTVPVATAGASAYPGGAVSGQVHGDGAVAGVPCAYDGVPRTGGSYPAACAVAGGASVAGPGPPPPPVAAVSAYPSVCYPPYPGSSGCGGAQECSYPAPPPVYATAGPYDAASCTYRPPAPPAAEPTPGAAGGFPGPAPAMFPAGDASASSGQERNYTDLRSVSAPAVSSLSELLQNKLTGWPAGGSGGVSAAAPVSAAAAASVPYCGTPQSEDSGVEVDVDSAKHPASPPAPADETIGEILKKTMVESVSA